MSDPPCVLLDLSALLQLQVLRRLPPEDLARFALASRSAWQAAAADELWRGPWLALAPAAEGRAPPLPPPPDGHRAAFARLRRRACADCGAQTRHVFALLNRRLCQRCEAHDPGRYGLATELEARERWGLGEAALDALPCVEAFRRRWFLRSAVAALAEARERPAATGEESDSSGGSGRDGDSSGGGGSQGGEEQEPTAGWQPAAGAPEGSSSGGGGGDNGGEGDAAAVLARLRALELQQAQREARRAARKEHKKQVKADKRAARGDKAQGLHWPGGPLPAPNRQQQPAARSGARTSPGGHGGGGRGAGRDRRKERYQQQKQHPERGAKSTSAWLEERSQLMAEFGQPDASGLVLADD